MSDVVERFRAARPAALESMLRWRAGTLGDYAALAQFHYLRNKPVTAMRVIVLEVAEPKVLARWYGGHLDYFVFSENKVIANAVSHGKTSPKMGAGASPAGRVIGVLVESLPALSCALRDVATGGRYGGWKDRRMAARLLNSEVRCISRVVVHPQWRGLGLAVKLVRRALQTMTTPYTEALAAMGRVHPFFRLAEMSEYRRPALSGRQRLIDAMRYCGVEAWELASAERMAEHLGYRGLAEDGHPVLERHRMKRELPGAALLRRELGRWAGRRLTVAEQLEKARNELLCEPVYYGFRKE